jgi:hypothetical protein
MIKIIKSRSACLYEIIERSMSGHGKFVFYLSKSSSGTKTNYALPFSESVSRTR